MTPKNAPYKKLQRQAKRATRTATVLWVSCEVVEIIGDITRKRQVQGTYRKALHGPIGTPRITGRRRLSNA